MQKVRIGALCEQDRFNYACGRIREVIWLLQDCTTWWRLRLVCKGLPLATRRSANQALTIPRTLFRWSPGVPFGSLRRSPFSRFVTVSIAVPA